MNANDDATVGPSVPDEVPLDELQTEVLGLIDEVVTSRLTPAELVRRRERIKAKAARRAATSRSVMGGSRWPVSVPADSVINIPRGRVPGTWVAGTRPARRPDIQIRVRLEPTEYRREPVSVAVPVPGRPPDGPVTGDGSKPAGTTGRPAVGRESWLPEHRPPRRGRRRPATAVNRRTAAINLVAVVVAVVAAVAVASGVGRGSTEPRPQPTASPARPWDDRPAGGRPREHLALRAHDRYSGFDWWHEPDGGFQIAVPNGWTSYREGKNAMFFVAPDGPPTLRVRSWGLAGEDRLTSRLAREEARVALGSYHRLRLAALPSNSGAVWEYTFRDPYVGRLRSRDRVLVANGETYLIQWRVPPAEWDANLRDLSIVTTSFRPREAP